MKINVPRLVYIQKQNYLESLSKVSQVTFK